MGRYKYYFKKPKSEITKDILKGLAVAGVITLAGVLSPSSLAASFWRSVLKRKNYTRKRFYDVFYRLRKEGCFDIQEHSHQVYISLTEEGKKRAGRFQIDSLNIKKPKQWDRKWRIVIFDISHLHRFKREAFRGKLKQLGFCQLQKSVWVHPYNCEDEIKLLQEFLNLTSKEIRLIVADKIWDDKPLKQYFKVI